MRRGLKLHLSDEVKNLKAALEKEDADLDELNTQVQDLLKRISLTIQNERDNSKQDPEVLVLYQKLYNGVIALHTYLEMNNGSDADFEKVDALFDKLSAAKQRQASSSSSCSRNCLIKPGISIQSQAS